MNKTEWEIGVDIEFDAGRVDDELCKMVEDAIRRALEAAEIKNAMTKAGATLLGFFSEKV